MQTSSVSLYQGLNVTLRMRYYGFYAWLADIYGQKSWRYQSATMATFRAPRGGPLRAHCPGGQEAGVAGVDHVLEIMQGELKLVMGNCGTQSVADINRAYVSSPDWKI
jgi:hypothetical protein